LNELTKLLGWLFDSEKEVSPSFIRPFLGAIGDYTMVDSQGVIGIQPKPQFVRGVEMMPQQGILYRRLPSGDVRSFVGKLIHLASMYEGRVGRGQTLALAESLGEKELKADYFVHNLELHLCYMRLEPFWL
jgi:hypothetical protein